MGNNSRPDTIVIVSCVLNAPLMLISIIGNTLVLAAILRTSSLRSPSTAFICSLAASDLLVGLVVQPVYIARGFTLDLYKISETVAFAACGVSLFTMTAINVDRFLALHYHMRYPTLMTTYRAILISAILWLISFLLSFLTFWSMDVYYFVIAFSIVVCLLLSSVCYIRIYRIVRQHQLQIHVQQQAVDQSFNTESSHNIHRSTKSAKSTFIYYIVMILCYTPVFIAMSILVISPHHWTKVWNITDTVAFMNSSINPFLYCWRICELRTKVVETARQMLCKQTEER